MSVYTRLLFEVGVRLIPVIVKAGLAIFGIGGQGGSGVAVNLCPLLMVFCPATHGLNGMLALMCSIPQTALHGVDSSSWIGWPVRVVVFVVSEVGSNGAALLTDCSATHICRCAVAYLVSCLHSAVLQQLMAVFMPM
jgi:hypothetical protein